MSLVSCRRMSQDPRAPIGGFQSGQNDRMTIAYHLGNFKHGPRTFGLSKIQQTATSHVSGFLWPPSRSVASSFPQSGMLSFCAMDDGAEGMGSRYPLRESRTDPSFLEAQKLATPIRPMSTKPHHRHFRFVPECI